jgi:hypothetical protein
MIIHLSPACRLLIPKMGGAALALWRDYSDYSDETLKIGRDHQALDLVIS